LLPAGEELLAPVRRHAGFEAAVDAPEPGQFLQAFPQAHRQTGQEGRAERPRLDLGRPHHRQAENIGESTGTRRRPLAGQAR